MFFLAKIENGHMNVPEPEFHDATEGEAISIGEALVLTKGKFTKCGATASPDFISMTELPADATDRRMAACRVAPNQVYEVPVTADPSSLVAGDKVTINTDGLQVTATKASGVATIIDTLGVTAAGGKILVRFIKAPAAAAE